MDAQKNVRLTMQEIKEIKLCLEEKVDVLLQEEDQKGRERKLETIQRVIQKLEH
jgi:hypothetical protein